MTRARLSRDEDTELRRLDMLRRFGNVAGSIAGRYAELRRRDRRSRVRAPAEAGVVNDPTRRR